MIDSNLNDYLVKSKYSKVFETALYQQNYAVFVVPKRGVLTPNPPPHGCTIVVAPQNLGDKIEFAA